MEKITDHYWLPPGIDYLRWMDGDKVIRVAKVAGGRVLALYPSPGKDVFYGEAFTNIDDESPRSEVRRETIDDELWLKLLDGESREKIFETIESVRDPPIMDPLF